MADDVVKVSFLGDASSLKRATVEADGHMSKLGGRVADFAKAAAVGFAAVGVAAGVFAKSAVNAASDLSESQAKVGVVFGEQAREIEDWASRSSRAFGMSKQQALEAAGSYGNLFRAFGLGATETAIMSEQLTMLAADLASFNNTSVEDAIAALSSGLSGEMEPMKKYGAILSDVRLKEEAVRLGLIKTTKEALDPAAKAQASYSLIMKDTALAQGDFARTSDGLANQTRILKARFTDIQAEIGTKLLPVVVAMAGFILDRVIPAFSFLAREAVLAVQLIVGGFQSMDRTSSGFHGRMEEIGIVARRVFEWMRDNIPPVFEWMRDNIPPVLAEIVRIGGDIFQERLIPAFQALADVAMNQIWPALQTVFNFVNENREILVGVAVAIGVMLVAAFVSWAAAAGAAAVATIAATAPIIAIGVAIAALVAGVIYAYQNWDWFRNSVDAVARFLRDDLLPVLRAVGEFIMREVVPRIVTLIGWFIEVGKQVASMAIAVGKAIADVIQFFVNVGIAVYQFAQNFAQFVLGMAQQLAEWVTTVWRIGGEVIKWFRDLPGEILKGVGNLGRLLFDIGKQVIQGLWDGIENVWAGLKNRIGDIGNSIKDKFKDVLRISSPSRVMYEIGEYTIEGLNDGMVDASGPMLDAADAIAMAIPTPFEGLLDPMFQVGESMMDGLAAGLAAGRPAISHELDEANRQLEDWARRGVAILDENGRRILDARELWENVIAPVGSIVDPFAVAALPSFDGGGMVSGPIGAPQLAVVHGGERVLTPEQQAGGQTINIYIAKVNAHDSGEVNTMAASMSRELAVALRGSV